MCIRDRIGSQKVINVDVRIIAATNRDVYELVRQGKFREDLYYRLNVLPLSIPSLRERGSDVMLLAEHFMKMFRKNLVFTETARRRMESYRWSCLLYTSFQAVYERRGAFICKAAHGLAETGFS